MSPITILLLSTYPFRRPRHGGQIRLSEIARVYGRAGFIVHSIAVYESEGYDRNDVIPNDVSFPSSSQFRLYRGRTVPFINDLLTGKFAALEHGAFWAIQRRLPKRVDVIHIEQPWLLPLAQRLRSELSTCRHACFIYGSQNVEAALKKSIFESYDMNEFGDVLQEIDALERAAARESHLAFAVTDYDKSVLEDFGAQNVALAPNGASPWRANDERLDYWRSRLPTAPWILFIASAHPPNFTGFVQCMGDSLACIPPNSRLVVVGTVGEHIYRILSNTRWRDLNLSRLMLLWRLDDDDLAAVKTLAHAFLLPILNGGGSNLKTAEALYSGKYVICTPSSMRGFEAYRLLPELTIAESPKQFQTAIRDVLCDAPAASSTPEATEIRKRLRWDHCLAALPDAVMRLVKTKELVT